MTDTHKLDRIERLVERLEGKLAGLERELNMKNHPSCKPEPGTLLKQVPIELDWLSPGIHEEVSFVEQEDGRVAVFFQVSGEDALVVKHLLGQLPVDKLVLSAY